MMLRKGGFSFEMNLDREVIRVQDISKSLTDLKPVILKAMGVQAVSWAVQDYRTKSDKGSAGGITWQPISLSAARGRLSHRAPYQDQTKQLKAIHDEEKPILEKLKKFLPSDETLTKGAVKRFRARKKSIHPGQRVRLSKATKEGIANLAANRGRRIRAAIVAQFMKNNPEWKKLIEKRKKIKAKRVAMIAKEHAAARIGIDTGRLVNSLVYAVSELSAIKPPKLQEGASPPTPALFTVQGDSIHIGSLMKYATYFDEKRPIFGPTFIDSGRREQLDRIIDLTIRASLKQKGSP